VQSLVVSAHWFFTWLWRASWQASLVILLVLLAQGLLRDRLAPRWRHALWLIVVVRLVLPWRIESPLSLFNLFHADPATGSGVSATSNWAFGSSAQGESDLAALPGSWRAVSSWWVGVPSLWLSGAAVLLGYVLASTWRLGRAVRKQRPVTDGAVLDLLENCKEEMGVRTPLSLIELHGISSPSLFGFVRPRLLLPAGLLRTFSRTELRYVFLHELGHIKRADIPLNWLSVVPLILHWFNPLVWYAFCRMRVDGELACDALALSQGRDAEKQCYGQTLIKLVESFSRPALMPGLVGILENNNQMKRRISMIATFKQTTYWPIAAASLLAALSLVTLTDAQSGQGGQAPRSAAGAQAPIDPQGPPRILATSPGDGETEVNPAITEITVTFDRDMGDGFSWTGGGAEFPGSPAGKKAQWRDKRTCVLPVELQAGHFYRVGINAPSFHGFASTQGVAAVPSAIYFTTQGASETLKRRVSKPKIVGLIPRHGAKDVDPNLAELRVSFNVPMAEGFSWVGGGPEFPEIPNGKKPFWTEDHKTCVLPVALKPNSSYHLGLNSVSHQNFRSAGGIPLDPMPYAFSTR
jgi:bla regulator protein BlaR1